MSCKMGKMEEKRKILVKDLNTSLTCLLCEGYLIDATVLADCLHVFCRGCIIKYFDNCRTACPNCNMLYKKKNQICFRPDPLIQSLVYKIVPGLYSKEMQTREDFYRSTGVRASSSCSDDSVIDKERDNLKDQEAWVTSNVGDKAEFFSADDMISLSIEYYQAHLDTRSTKDKVKTVISDKVVEINSESRESSNLKIDSCEVSEHLKRDKDESKENGEETGDKCRDESKEHNKDDDKRYLKCPAAVSMQLLQRFLRMKFGLTADHRVDIIYRGEVLPNFFTLMDVAYTFKWNRAKPMRFFYRIFTPMKVKPIKIINTSSTSGSKLQIVQIDERTKTEKVEKQPEQKPEKIEPPKFESPRDLTEGTEDHKERLMANLQLKKKHQNKTHEKEKEVEKEPVCVYEYVEPDKEEIKRFAEKRDREWALQKKLDEKNNSDHYFSKKKKKSKHSKNESVHKKRKLHAEITSNEEEDLKLKVKLTSHNSHKHKHHKNSQNHLLSAKEALKKEKLLEMRQVRHKPVNSEDKTVQTIPTSNINVTKQPVDDKISEKSKIKERDNEKKEETENKSVRFVDTGTSTMNVKSVEKKEETKSTSLNQIVTTKDNKKSIVLNLNKPGVKEWSSINRMASVKAERVDPEKHKMFKSFPTSIERDLEKMKQANVEIRSKLNNVLQTGRSLTPLEKKINSIQQQCTIEAKKAGTPPPPKVEKVNDVKPQVLSPYPPGFTVSKIEAGVKRKAENDGQMPDKRPSLEITLIPSQGQSVMNRSSAEKIAAQKRPLPSTIPLDKIKKSINLKSGISIIPKLPDVCDNIGALDLSNKSPENSPKPTHSVTKTLNGMNMVITNLRNHAQKPSVTNEKTTHQLSNLQMLSKVASEHPILNKLPQQVKTSRANIPHLQTLSTTLQNSPASSNSLATSTAALKPNLPKMPKLTEISKTQFKAMGVAQIRTPRPNQNQNIRNIPNPSLLVKQQNQNRLNSISANVEKETINVANSVSAKVNNIVEKKEIPV
ncbi:hypothetical protein HHI36_021532 [Cryptolaemus montrouzieri]|uniref:RING-type domain-containing protein n=1 Tax=Cryptolaemus montrouzieri TaxID=559131 RepID=A0ABD2MY67_9CUCU